MKSRFTIIFIFQFRSFFFAFDCSIVARLLGSKCSRLFCAFCLLEMSVNSIIYLRQILICLSSELQRCLNDFLFLREYLSLFLLIACLSSPFMILKEMMMVKWCELKKFITSWVNNCRTLGTRRRFDSSLWVQLWEKNSKSFYLGWLFAFLPLNYDSHQRLSCASLSWN